MPKFTANELRGREVYIDLRDGQAWMGQIRLADNDAEIDNVRGVDIHIDMKEDTSKISATLKLHEGDYHNPTLVDVHVTKVEGIVSVEEVEAA